MSSPPRSWSEDEKASRVTGAKRLRRIGGGAQFANSLPGLDVHARTVVACLSRDVKKQTRTFSTMTDELLRLLDWFSGEGCTHVAIESTGVYWKPIFNLLEGVLEVVLVNARQVKAVPGRKTDVRDGEWLADLLQHGLLTASFIPPLEIRELRELTRYRQTLVHEQASVANRVLRIIESGNIKLGQVASNALGVSGRLMLRSLCEGETDGAKLAALARGQLKKKEAELRRAGATTDTKLHNKVRLSFPISVAHSATCGHSQSHF